MLTALERLEQMEVSVYFEEQGLTRSMNSEMFATFPGMIAQQESISISQNMRWSYQKRMNSGEFNCAPAYGFDLINGELVINENGSGCDSPDFNLYRGIGMQKIANLLNADEVSRQALQVRKNGIIPP